MCLNSHSCPSSLPYLTFGSLVHLLNWTTLQYLLPLHAAQPPFPACLPLLVLLSPPFPSVFPFFIDYSFHVKDPPVTLVFVSIPSLSNLTFSVCCHNGINPCRMWSTPRGESGTIPCLDSSFLLVLTIICNLTYFSSLPGPFCVINYSFMMFLKAPWHCPCRLSVFSLLCFTFGYMV